MPIFVQKPGYMFSAPAIEFTTVCSRAEVEQMLVLQAANLGTTLDPAVKLAQGFLTVRHEPAILQRMNEIAPAIIAKAGDQVVGYALVMPPSFANQVPVLRPMFDLLAMLSWKGQSLQESARWFVMGQICVAEGYRGGGILDSLYAKMREVYGSDYDFTVTEISARNTRSLRAHERAGFQTLRIYDDPLTGETWHVVGLELK